MFIPNTTNSFHEEFIVITNHPGYKWTYYAAFPSYLALMVIDLWILISLVHHGIKTKKWQHFQKNKSENLNSGYIYTSVIVCACLCLVYHSLVLVHHHIGYRHTEQQACDSIGDLIKSLYGFVVLTINIFLWLRQRVFYTNKMSNARFGKGLKVFSFSIIFLIFVGGVSGYILSAIPNDNIPSLYGCIYEPKGNLRLYSVFVSSFSLIFGQIILVCLLIYALLVYNGNISKYNCLNAVWCNNPKQTKVENVSSKRRASASETTERTKMVVQKIIRKTVLFAVLSLASDTLVITLALQFKYPHTRGDFAATLACVAVQLNLLFMILSFVSWKDMLFSPFRASATSSRTRSINYSEKATNKKSLPIV